MAKATVQSNMLKTVLPRLFSQPAQDALEKLDIKLVDHMGNIRDVVQVYTEVAQRMQLVSEAEQIEIAEGLGGKFHISRIQALLHDLQKTDSMYKQIEESSRNSAGSALEENEKYMESLEAKTNLLRVEYEKLALSIGEAFVSDGVIAFTSTMSELLQLFTHLVKNVGIVAPLLATFGLAFGMLNRRAKETALSLYDYVQKLRMMTTEQRRSITIMDLFSKSSKSLGITLRGVTTALVGFGALFAAGMAIEFITKKFMEAKQRADELKAAQEQLMSTYKASRGEIQDLVKDYDYLEKTLSNTQGQDERARISGEMAEVQNKLAELMPDLVVAEDEYGNKILESSDIMKIRIELLERELELNEQKLKQEKVEQRDEDISSFEKNIDNYEKRLKQLENSVDDVIRGVGHKLGASIVEYEGYGNTIEDLIEFMDRLKEAQKQALLDDDQNLANRIGNELTKVQTFYTDLATIQGQAESDMARLTSLYAELFFEQAGAYEWMDQSGQALLGSLAMIGQEAGMSSEEIKSGFDAIRDSLLKDEELQGMVTNYQEVLAEFKKAQSDFDVGLISEEKLEAEKVKFDEVAKEIQKTLMDLFKSLDLDANVFSSLSDNMENFLSNIVSGADEAISKGEEMKLKYDEVQQSLYLLDGDGENFGEIKKDMEEIIKHTDDLIVNLTEYGFILEGVTEEEYLQAKALEETIRLQQEKGLTTEELDFETRRLIQAYEAEQQIMNQLYEMYPHLLGAEDMAKLSKTELIAKIQEEMLAQDLLIGAMELVANGQVTSEQHRSITTFKETRARIEQYRQELAALKTLEQAMNSIKGMQGRLETELEAAIAIGDRDLQDRIGKQLMRFGAKTASYDNKILGLNIELNNALSQQSTQMKELVKIDGILSNSKSNLGKSLDRLNKEMGKGSKANKNNAKAKKDNAKATKESTKAEEEAIFIADKYKRALEELELELKKIEAIKKKTPEYSKQHQDALKKEIRLEEARLDLMKEQAKMMEQQIKQGKVQKTGVVTSQVVSGSTTSRNLAGWGGRVTSQYGMRKHPIFGDYRMHSGVDIAGARGQRLDANVDGKVVRAGKAGGFGNLVVVQDAKGMQHFYAHLDKIAVKVGQEVRKGMQVGNIGSTGNSTGPHLHYEVRNKSGKVVNPNQYMQQAKGKVQVTQSTIKNVQKEIAQGQKDVFDLQSDLLGMEGDILSQQAKIEELKMDLINTELAVYSESRRKIQNLLDLEIAKYESLDKTTDSYIKTMDKQKSLLADKQRVNKQEERHLLNLIKNGKLTAIQMDELSLRLEELKLQMIELNYEIGRLEQSKIDAFLTRFTESASRLNYELEKSRLFMKQFEEGTAEWNAEGQKQIEIIKQIRENLQSQINNLQELINTSNNLSPEAIIEYRRQLEQLSLQWLQLGLEIDDFSKSMEDSNKKALENIADRAIELYKQVIRERQNSHMRQLDREMKAEDERHKKVLDNYKKELDSFKKAVQERIDEIDKAEEDRTFKEDIEDLQKQRRKISTDLAILEGEDTLEAKAKRKKLNEELASIDKAIRDRERQKEIKDRKDNLNDILKDKEEEISEKEQLENEYYDNRKKQIDDEREYWNKHYEDLLNDERKFAKMREEILAGNFDNIEAEFKDMIQEMIDTMPELENDLNGTMEAVGTAIRQNLIDNLREALSLMENLQSQHMSGGVGGSGGTTKPPSDSWTGAGLGGKDKAERVFSEADLKVLAGKMIIDEMVKTSNDPIRKKSISNKGHALAAEGRGSGSKIPKDIDYDQVIMDLTPEDRKAFAQLLRGQVANQFITPEYIEFIKRYANRIELAGLGFRKGGYTGNKSGLGLLHENEFILNKEQTSEALKMADLFDNIKHMTKNFNRSGDTNTDSSITVSFDVEKMYATEEEAKGFANQLMNDLKRRKGVRFS